MIDGHEGWGEMRGRKRGCRYGALFGLLATWLWLGCHPGTPGSERGLRNLVLICFDTVRFDAFQAASIAPGDDPRARWVHRALRLERAQTPASWTVPAVASVLTGLDPIRHGAGVFPSAVANLARDIPTPISPAVVTLAEQLQEQGFDTVALVAHPWFLSGYGLERGFDSLALERERRRLIARGVTWLEARTAEQEASRFLLYLHLMDSHGHLKWESGERRLRAGQLPPAARQAATATGPGIFCNGPHEAACTNYLSYVQSITEQLHSVFEVLDALEGSGLLSETLVILYSDHGEEFLDHAKAERARGVDPRGVYGFGHGQSLYQELLHVPVWIWHPELEGRTAAVPASLLDLMPTALEWLRVEGASAELDGRSLAGFLTGEAPPPDDARPLYATRIAYGPEQLAVVSGPWKRIWHGATERELFDLSLDPREHAPAKRPAVELALDALLAAYQARESVETAEPPTLTENELEQLRSLGYLEDVSPGAGAEPDNAKSP